MSDCFLDFVIPVLSDEPVLRTLNQSWSVPLDGAYADAQLLSDIRIRKTLNPQNWNLIVKSSLFLLTLRTIFVSCAVCRPLFQRT